MTHRRDLGLIFLLGLSLHTLAAAFVLRPDYMDAYYYFGGAVQLAQGRGFTEPYWWNYLAGLTTLPAPSHLYWMPLPSLVAAPFVAVAQALAARPLSSDALFHAAQIPFLVAGAALPLLSYTVAQQLTGLRRQAWLAAWLTLFSGYYFLYWTTTDGFALFGLCAAGALLAVARASTSSACAVGWWFVAGLLAGGAHLTRADGPLVLMVGLGWAAWHWGQHQQLRRWPRAALLALGGYLVVMLPWFLRNWLVVGTPLAPGGAATLWLVRYDDLFLYPATLLTPERYFAAGWATLWEAKWWALQTNVGTVIGVLGLVVAWPFMLAGLWQLRRQPVMQLATLYLLALFGVMTFIFSFSGARGGLLHSGVALLPFLCVATWVGLDTGVEAMGRVLRHWQPAKSKPIFAVLLAAFLTLVTLGLFYARYLNPARTVQGGNVAAQYPQIGLWLNAHAEPAAVVLVNNPPGFYYHTGHPAIVVPNGQVPMLQQAATAFHARWLVLDENRPEPLAAVYEQPTAFPALILRETFWTTQHKPIYLFEIHAP